MGASSRFGVRLAEVQLLLAAEELARSPDKKAERRIADNALTANRRGTDEELGMTVADRNARYNQRRLRPDLDQDHNYRSHRHRRRRVHGNAKLAMVGVSFQRMGVCYLNDGQQRQQGKTHNSDRRQSTQLCRPSPAELCLEFCQMEIPRTSRITV
jgi:hypothetical protein